MSTNPSNLLSLQSILNIMTMLVLLVYVVFALTAYIKIKRLEKWLMTLRRYNFPRYARIHFILATIGFILSFLLLFIPSFL